MANQPQNSQPGQPALITDREKQPSNNGTGFVNLQKYLNANQGNQLGNAVSGNINQATQATQQDLSGQQQQFNQGLQNARSGLARGQQNVAGIFQNIDNPNFSGLSDDQVQNYQNITNNPYQGPTGYQNPQLLQQKAANTASLGQLAQSRPGRQELLRETVNAPQYSRSQQNMDELFLSLGGGQNAVRQAGRATRQLPGQIQQQVGAAQQQGQQTQRDYNKLQQEAKSGVQSRQSDINNSVTNSVQQAQSKQQQQTANFATYQQMLANGDPNAANFAANNGLLSGNTANNLSQIAANLPSASHISQDLYSNINQGSIPTTPGAAASAQQKAQLQALAKLSGQEAPSWINEQTQNSAAPAFRVTEAQKQQILNDVMNKYYSPDQQTQLSQLAGGALRPNIQDYGQSAQQQFLALNPDEQSAFLNNLQNQGQYGFNPEVAQSALGIYKGIQQGQQAQQQVLPLLNRYLK